MCKKALVVFTFGQARDMFDGREGKQALDYAVRIGLASREFFVDGIWVSTPKGKVSGCRFNINGEGSKIEDAAKIWRYIKANSIQTPAKGDKVIEQLLGTRKLESKLVMFSPWGPRYNKSRTEIKETDPEVVTLREIGEIFQRFKRYSIDLILMPADAYGTEVNNLSAQFVDEYFSRLEDRAQRELDGSANITIKRWSLMREENADLYKDLREEIEDDLSKWMKDGEYEKAVRAARNFNPMNPEESARRYCIERLVEGRLVDRIYDPIKLSLVKKEKDTLDGQLMRIYLVRNRAPWIEGE